MSRRRLRVVVGSAAIGILGLAGAVGLLHPHGRGPSIYIATPVVDIGRVKPGQEILKKIRIENRGGKTLMLGEPTASCGCQRPLLRRRELAAGESTELEVRQTASFQNGPFQHAIFIGTNDVDLAEARVFLRGTVTTGIVVRPEPLVLGTVRTGQQVRRVLEVLSDEGKPFRITFLNSSGPITARDLTDKADVLHKIEVTSTGGRVLGPFRAQVVINFDRGENQTLFVPVVGVVAGAVQIAPSMLALGRVEGYSEQQNDFVITSSDAPIKVIDVQPPPGGWKTTYQAVELEGRRSRVRLRVMFKVPNIPNEIDGDMSVIVERSGSKEELTVPVTGTITAADLDLGRNQEYAAHVSQTGVHAH